MSEYSATIDRRLRFVGVVVIIVSAIMIWRMFDIQVVKHNHYTEMALGQQRFERSEMAQRGKIYLHDSYFNPQSYYPLSFDVKKFAVWVVPGHVKEKEKTAKQISDLISLPYDEVFEKINNDKLYIPPAESWHALESCLDHSWEN